MNIFQKIFLRNPKRNIPLGNNLISPAHGKIVRILDTSKNIRIRKGLLGHVTLLTKDISNECLVICIMMNIHNIHIQRSPISGEIINQKYSKGKFMNVVSGAEKLEWLENERNEIVIFNKKHNMKVRVVQVAGAFAKRIKSYVKTKQEIKKGEDIGHITFGSQVTVIVPKNKIKLTIKEKDIVTDGETILGELK